MPKKCLTRAKGVRSVPEVGSRNTNSQTSSLSSMSTDSSVVAFKQLKKDLLAQKKATQEASRSTEKSTKSVPKHLVSHMLPFFYPKDYEYNPPEDNAGVEVPRHLVSHVTSCCYPVSGTVDEEDAQSSRSDVVPRHLQSHVTRYCYPVTGTLDDEDVLSPRPDVVPPHLESHVALYCRPVDDDGVVIEEIDCPKLAKHRRTNYVPPNLQSHLFGSVDESSGRTESRTGINCEMTRNHPNMCDRLFLDVVDSKPMRRVGGRRPVPNTVNLFEESKPKPRPMSITIVQRPPEDTKENIFGSESMASLRRRTYPENDTKKTIFGGVDKDDEACPPTPRSRNYEDTTEKLFGETYGIKEAQDGLARRRRPKHEDTQMTLFGPPPPPPTALLQRPQSERSLAETHENLFGQQLPSQSGRRLLRRENTFDNLFGHTTARCAVAPGVDERYTTKNPKMLKVSRSFV